MKNEKLMRAMGEIDEDLIIEARNAKRPRIRWARWTALAACLAVVMLCTPVLFIMMENGIGGGAMAEADHYYAGAEDMRDDLVMAPADERLEIPELDPSEMNQEGLSGGILNSNMLAQLEEIKKIEASLKGEQEEECFREGDTVRRDGWSLQYLEADDASLAFHVKKDTDAPLVLSVIAFVPESQEISHAISIDSNSGQYLVFTVNGETRNDLPSAKGAYDITVDLSEILKNSDWSVSPYIFVNDAVLIWK